MAAIATTGNQTEKREKRAQSIAAMGLVNRENDKFSVSTPSLRGKQTSYEVRRDSTGKIRCNCLGFEEACVTDSGFRCEHILAVKYALVQKNTERVTKQPIKLSAEIEIVSNDRPVFESSSDVGARNADSESAKSEIRESMSKIKASKPGEQKMIGISTDVLENGQSEVIEVVSSQLTNTQGEINMRQISGAPFLLAGEMAIEGFESPSNVLNFTSTLKELRRNVDPNLVRRDEGSRNLNDTALYVDFVEWYTVADLLDEHAPDWSHAIRGIRRIGQIVTVIVAITIDGVTREGLGTGVADSEMGIKKAEHDALKRAAVKFGVGRGLYENESDAIEREGGGFPTNPIARSLSDLVTAKQLGMIRAISREVGVDADEECDAIMQCRTDELSKKAASGLIQHLQDFQKQQESVSNVDIRRAR